MTVGQIMSIVSIVAALLAIIILIVFLIWWNRMERKKDEIMMRCRERQYEILMSVLSKKDEEDA